MKTKRMLSATAFAQMYICLGALLSAVCSSGEATQERLPERLGTSAYFIMDGSRYWQPIPEAGRPKNYPIPTAEVRREDYMEWLEDSGLLELANMKDRGRQGVAEFIPILAKYVQTKDRKWGEACVVMLKEFHLAVKSEIALKGWVDGFNEEPAFLPLYRRHLIEGGLLDESKESWFRDLFLDYARNLHVWGSADSFWRGPCHRAQPEGFMRGLAAKLYPDIPEAAEWTRYSTRVFQDFWEVKDLTENDTGYSMNPTFVNMIAGPELRGNDEYVTNPEMRLLWDRLVAEVTPDGAVNCYGPNGGYNSTAPCRVWMLELAAAKTGDGRYRFAAHKLFNYLRYQKEELRRHRGSWVQETTQHIALAWLFADDRVKPVQPAAASQILYRKQVLRVENKERARPYLNDLDLAPDKGKPCCYLLIENKNVPNKLVFRSGWNPGDFYALVDLFIGADPLNPGGIIGLTRWGAPFTQVCSTKGSSEDNRIVLEDLSGKARRRYEHTPGYLVGESWAGGGWGSGKSTAAKVSVPVFQDTQLATFATVEVLNYQSLPVNSTREYVFVKNRFIFVRDVLRFEEGFTARVAPIWNTQNIGPQIGTHFANTFFTAPRGGGSIENPLKTPPYDLLVWFAPRKDCRLQIIDRSLQDNRAAAVPAQLRYTWEGEAKAGQQLHFTQLFHPRRPVLPRLKSNHPGAKVTFENDLDSTAGAAGITAEIDTPETVVLKIAISSDHKEWVVSNPAGTLVKTDIIETDARFAYISKEKNKPVRGAAISAKKILFEGQPVDLKN